MNANFQLKILQRMYGLKIASAIEAASGGCVSERTARNWFARKTIPAPALLERLRAAAREDLLKTLEGKQWAAGKREAFAQAFFTCPGPVSTFAFVLQHVSGATWPAFLRLASEIDLLEERLDAHRATGDMQGYVQALMAAPWISEQHWTNIGDGTDAAANRRMLYAAESWNDLGVPLSVLVVNTQLQLLATLDLEFCSAYLPDIEATPIFASLLPRVDARVDLSARSVIARRRDMFHYPTRRMLDVIACLRRLRENPGRQWPRTIPAAGEMMRWLQLAGCAELASNLPKWRSGRTLTTARFGELWSACFGFLPEPERPSAPIPMLYAATVFSELFVKGSREEGNLTFLVPEPSMYRNWWSFQLQALSAGPQPPGFGGKKWMAALA